MRAAAGAGRLALACLALCVASAGPAAAHRTSLAHVSVEGSTEAEVALTLSAHDLAAALGLPVDVAAPAPVALLLAEPQRIAAYLDQRLALRAGDRPCIPGATRIEETRPGEELRVIRAFSCTPDARGLTLSTRLFFDIDEGHRAILEAGGRQSVIDRAFTSARLSASAREAPPGLARLLALGIEHILFGIDHVLFLVVLLLGLPRLWPALAMVTAFTLAHSLTLALAWFGLLALPARLVETAIALSIAWVAVENLLGRGAGRRWLIAGLFGLVHGLGFSAALADLGLAGAGAARVLLGFNLGVEIGQLTIIAAAAPVLWWTSRQRWRRHGVRAASAASLLLALWWAGERALA